MSSHPELHLSQPFPPIARILGAVAGSAIIAVVVTELWSGIWPPGWHSLIFGPIFVGGVVIGALLLVASVIGEQTTWTVSDTEIVIRRRKTLGARRDIVSLRDLVGVDLHESEWDSRPSTFGVVLRDADGKRLVSPDCASKADAQRLRDRLRANLGTTP